MLHDAAKIVEKRAQSMLLVVVALSAVHSLTLDIISRAPQFAIHGILREWRSNASGFECTAT